MSDYGITKKTPDIARPAKFPMDEFQEEHVQVFVVELEQLHMAALHENSLLYFSLNDHEYGVVIKRKP